MPVRPLIPYPDPRLQAMSVAVRVFDAELEGLAADILDTMRAAPGIGMAASHIGVLERLVVIELSRADGAHIYVNPEIIWRSTDTTTHVEGSVSMPGVTELVERPASVHVRYQDLAGFKNIVKADGLLAVCLQHEIDQLDGIFWTARLSRLKRERLLKRLSKLARLP